MQNRKVVMLVVSILLILFMFGCGQKQEVAVDMPEMETDQDESQSLDTEQGTGEEDAEIDIKSIFPKEEGFLWRYEGPIETGKTVLLSNVEVTEDGTHLHTVAILDDASGEKALEDRVKKVVYTITDDAILENGRPILKMPIEVDSQWQHQHVLRDTGEVRYATTRITEVTEDTVKTETKVENVFGYPNEEYLETNVYSVGAGYIDQSYNLQGIQDLEMGFFIYKTYMKPYDEEASILQADFTEILFEGQELKAHPIVAYDQYLIGGTYAGKWIDAYSMAPKLVGQETYRVFSMDKMVEQGLGSSPTKEIGGFEWYKVEILSPYGDVIAEQYDEPKNYQDYFSKQLAVSADWSLLPRRVENLSTNSETYRDVVNEFLAGIDMGHVPVDIKQVLRVDLEGDGTDEVIITASSYKAPIDFMSMPDRYSLVILRKIMNGKVENILLAGDYHKKDDFDSLNYIYYVPFVLDLNGDGRMEIVTEGMYYEGQWLEILDVDGSVIQSVLADGPQL